MLLTTRSERYEYPRLVAIETTNRCNVACTFCPNARLARDRQTMSDALFEKIVDDCRHFPLEEIEPFLNGEPFMDPKIVPRIEYIRRTLPKTRLNLYTNGNLMTPERIDQLAGLGIDRLFVSLNSLDPETYRREIGLSLEKTLSNLAYLTDTKRRSRVAHRIAFRMTRTSAQTLPMQDRFIEFCRRSGVRPFIVGQFNYKGDIASPLPVPGYPCEHIGRLDILASGRSTLCCQDHEGRYGWGDLNRNSVLEVFNSDRARRTRSLHRSGLRREMTPCGSCNLFWPAFAHCGLSQGLRFLIEASAYFLVNRPNGRREPMPPAAHDGGSTNGPKDRSRPRLLDRQASW